MRYAIELVNAKQVLCFCETGAQVVALSKALKKSYRLIVRDMLTRAAYEDFEGFTGKAAKCCGHVWAYSETTTHCPFCSKAFSFKDASEIEPFACVVCGQAINWSGTCPDCAYQKRMGYKITDGI